MLLTQRSFRIGKCQAASCIGAFISLISCGSPEVPTTTPGGGINLQTFYSQVPARRQRASSKSHWIMSETHNLTTTTLPGAIRTQSPQLPTRMGTTPIPTKGHQQVGRLFGVKTALSRSAGPLLIMILRLQSRLPL